MCVCVCMYVYVYTILVFCDIQSLRNNTCRNNEHFS